MMKAEGRKSHTSVASPFFRLLHSAFCFSS
jgi:hypothetical protein